MNEQPNADTNDIDAEIAQFERELGISDGGDAARNSLKFTDEQASEIDAELGSDDQNTLQQDGPGKSGSDTQTAEKTVDQKTEEPGKTDGKPTDPNAKQPSKYEKAREREQRGWKALNEEKQAIAKEREQIAAERKAWQEEQQAREAKAKAQDNEPSPEAYEKLAAEFEAKGDKDSLHQAKLARQLAAQRRKDIEAAKSAPQLMPEAEFSQKQKAALAQLVNEIPEIKDANGELNKAVQKMITEEAPVADLVETHPYGMYWVSKYARAERAAARVPDLEKQVAALNAELQKLRRNTEPISDSMVNPQLDAEETSFDDLPIEKMEAIVRNEMRAAGRL